MARPVGRQHLAVAAAAAGSAIAVAGMFASVGWSEAELWSVNHPVNPAPVATDGSASTRGVTIRYDGVAQVEVLQGEYGDPFTAPEGWVIWRFEFEVAGAGPDGAPFSTRTSVHASDGKTYGRSDVVPYDAEPEKGWIGDLVLKDGAGSEVVLLPTGVTPERIELVPTDRKQAYWSWDV